LKNYLFRVDADQSIGYGHYKRCLTILDYLDNNARSVMLTKSNALLDSNNFLNKIKLKKFSDISSEISFIDRIIKEYKIDVLISDINNYKTFKNPDVYKNYIDHLNGLKPILLSFEDFKIYDVNADIIVIPYIGSEKLNIDQKNKKKYLLGPKYFILRKEFISNKRKKITEKAKTILISMGGADSNNLTLNVINVLSNIGIDLKLNIVKGPLSSFSSKQCNQILRKPNISFKLFNSPDYMSKIIEKSDFAIVSSGLTQYETSAMGLPAIVISINDYHKKIVDEFATQNSIISYGVFKEKESYKLERLVHKLVDNKDLINIMSENGKNMIDGFGAKRILNKINNHPN